MLALFETSVSTQQWLIAYFSRNTALSRDKNKKKSPKKNKKNKTGATEQRHVLFDTKTRKRLQPYEHLLRLKARRICGTRSSVPLSWQQRDNDENLSKKRRGNALKVTAAQRGGAVLQNPFQLSGERRLFSPGEREGMFAGANTAAQWETTLSYNGGAQSVQKCNWRKKRKKNETIIWIHPHLWT